MKPHAAVPTSRFVLMLFLAALATAALAFPPSGASAAPVGKDGRIHACYKAKGKGKGTLRLVGSGKKRCPKKWRKVSWYTKGFTVGPGAPGPAGPKGERGEPGTTSDVVVGLEAKVGDLLTRVENLEAVLKGVTNGDLLNAIGLAPVVASVCEQTEGLVAQTTALGTTLGSLNTLLNTLLIGFSPVTVPTALPAFTCPTS